VCVCVCVCVCVWAHLKDTVEPIEKMLSAEVIATLDITVIMAFEKVARGILIASQVSAS